MNSKLKLCLFLLASVLLMSCEKEASPETVYKDYLASIQTMNSMSEDDYLDFISERAKTVVNKKLNGIDEERLDKFLIIFKAEAVLPENSQVNLLDEGEQVAVLNIITEDYPEKGSRHEKNIHFIREKGWKIDKIEVVTSGKDFKFTSSTY